MEAVNVATAPTGDSYINGDDTIVVNSSNTDTNSEGELRSIT
jgi:hypothetical protein